ncbi:DNA/RNA non-specific endonuclease [uncultured Sphingorhabdus sp.]|uniref:DNA/RNA non-specific endonuclease n=1 Tax=uncultured Sphingorhabdus sp. TaxID=1686106 RepID=UPI002608D77E|nr:DNA/RNA non-specific endonuclease [uncultured Sphingorhabdus sp.]HMS21605.1 DNA/RNA non-specific endonuclease [Sphingorhabdus sp.]
MVAGLGPVPEKPVLPQPDEENKTGILELKFNPWHDTEDGKFTFAGQGRNFGKGGGGSFGGGGASGTWGKPKPKERTEAIPKRTATTAIQASIQPKPTSKPKVRKATFQRPRQNPQVQPETKPPATTGGGRSPPNSNPAYEQLDSIVATGAAATAVAATALTTAGAAALAVKPFTVVQTVSAGGYNFDIDGFERAGKIYGKIRHVPGQTRSKRLQREAGRPDREPSDHGGHYIAREFGGPEIPENHFAQDAKINLGRYRRLENKWKRAEKRGSDVYVEITPQYTGSSKRPDSLEVLYKIDGKIRTKTIPNKTEG